MSGDRDQSGVAVVLVLGLVTVLLTVAFVAAGAVALVVGHRQAQAAADLAALAGAADLQAGRDACLSVGRVAAANGAATQSCVVDAASVEVTVVVQAAAVLGSRELVARARAGPAVPSPPTG